MKNWTRASTTLKEHAIFRTHVEGVNDAAQFQTPLSCSPLQYDRLRFDGKRTEECRIRDAQSSDWTAWVYREVSPRQDSSWQQEEGNFFTLCGWGSRLLKPGANGSGDTGCRPRCTRCTWGVHEFSPLRVWHHWKSTCRHVAWLAWGHATSHPTMQPAERLLMVWKTDTRWSKYVKMWSFWCPVKKKKIGPPSWSIEPLPIASPLAYAPVVASSSTCAC